jgi:hypothetical protein
VTEIPRVHDRWLDVKLEEYRALRSEVTTSITSQQSILSFGTATLALVFGPGLALFATKTELAISLIFNALIPLLSGVVLVIWWGEILRMVRAGEWLAQIEKDVNGLFATLGIAYGPLHWEGWLRVLPAGVPYRRLIKPPFKPFPFVRQFVINIRGVLAAFWTVALASLGLGLFLDFERGRDFEDATLGLSVFSLVALVLSGVFMWVRWRTERRLGNDRLQAMAEKLPA